MRLKLFSVFVLCQACIDGNFNIVKFLVDHGADINAPDNEGWTSLHAAVSCGFKDITQLVWSQL